VLPAATPLPASVVGGASKVFDGLAEWKIKGGQVLLANNYQFCSSTGSGVRSGNTPGTERLGTRQKGGSGRVLPSNVLI
jgi:hypothetical protein